jgi:Ankyrin repeats (3 copies)
MAKRIMMTLFLLGFLIIGTTKAMEPSRSPSDHIISFEKEENYAYKCYAKNKNQEVLGTISFQPCFEHYCYITSKMNPQFQKQGLGAEIRLQCIKKLKEAKSPDYGIFSYVSVANYPSLRNNKNTGMLAVGIDCETMTVNFVDSEETKKHISGEKYHKDISSAPKGCAEKIKNKIINEYYTGNKRGEINPQDIAKSKDFKSKNLLDGAEEYYQLIANTLLSDFGIKIKQEKVQELDRVDEKKTSLEVKKQEKKEEVKELSETDKLIQEQLSDQASDLILKGDLHSLQEMYIKNGKAFINTFNKEGLTLLHVAASSGKLEIVKWLVKNGANVKAGTKADKHETAANMASHKYHTGIAQFLNE